MSRLHCLDWDLLPVDVPPWCREAPGLEVWQAVSGDVSGWRVYAGAIPGGQILQLSTDLAGPDAHREAPFHYVVETDVMPGALEDFHRWYEEEHLPGLARVPGTVRARRYVRPHPAPGQPPFYACYDLMDAGVTESPPWLAVRGTAWSARVRPQFCQTRRTLFRRASWPPAPL